MTKEDFSQDGFSIVLPGDPEFGKEVKSQGLITISPYSVVVRNTSHRGIAAFGLRFIKRFSNGATAFSDVIATQPSALRDSGLPDSDERTRRALVMPGGARVVAPEGVVDRSRKVSTTYRTSESWTIIKVQVDSVLFDDGEVIGPDLTGLIVEVKVTIDAQQDLMEEISARLARGEGLPGILQELQSQTAPARVLPGATQLDPNQVYASVRQQLLHELSATEASAGAKVALDRIKQLRYVNRPNIRRKSGGAL